MEEATSYFKQREFEQLPHWCAITRVNDQRTLFRIPVVEGNAEGLDDIDSFVRDAMSCFHGALMGSKASLVHSEYRGSTHDFFPRHLRDIIALARGEKPLHGCTAIMDFTRTSLPQLSGKAARDAFAMAHYLGHWEESHRKNPSSYSPYLGFKGHGLVYDGKTWSKPADVAEQYYERLREDHPLVIFWRNKIGYCIIHPEHDKKGNA